MRPSLLAMALLLTTPAYAQANNAGDVPPKDLKAAASESKPDQDSAKASVAEDAQPLHRAIPFHGRTLAYVVTPGHVTIRNDAGEPIASIFYVAYTMHSAPGRPRPVTFLFNGGPGSSSMWLHMGSFGPLKIDASKPEMERPAPFRLQPNPDTLLDLSDLVFIDMPDSGFGRIIAPGTTKEFFGVDEDIAAFGQFIQNYITKFHRWNSVM